MHIWTLEQWVKNLHYGERSYRRGLRLVFDKDVSPLLRRECKQFAAWLRKEYFFPVRVPVYFRNTPKLRCRDGDTAYGTFFRPDSYEVEPYIRIAVGDFPALCSKWGEEDAVYAVLKTLSPELTHYFQWINGLPLTPIGEERQATAYAGYIMDEYAEIWDGLPSTDI